MTYNETSFFNVLCKFSVLGEKAVARVDHVNLVLKCNFDDFIASQVCSDGSVLASVSNLIGLIGLLPVHTEAVLMAVDSDRVEGQLMGSTENTYRNFSTIGN